MSPPLPPPTAETDGPRTTSPVERERYKACEKILDELRPVDTPTRSSCTDTASEHLPKVTIGHTSEKEVGDATTVKHTAPGADRSHEIDYKKTGGKLSEVTVGRTKYQRDAATGTWKASDGKPVDNVDVIGKGPDTRVVVTKGDTTTTIGADGASTTRTRGIGGSEHEVVRNPKGHITRVLHNGHNFPVKDGKVVGPSSLRGATVSADGTITGKVGQVGLKLNPDGSTEATIAGQKVKGYPNGSRVYNAASMRDSDRHHIEIGKDRRATVTKGGKPVAEHPLHDRRVTVDSTKQPPVLDVAATDKKPGFKYHLDGRTSRVEVRDGKVTSHLTDGKGGEIKITHDPNNPSKVLDVDGGRYGKVKVGTASTDAREIKVNHHKGEVTFTLNNGAKGTMDLAGKTTTLKERDGSERKTHHTKNYSDVRDKNGKLTVEHGYIKWNVTEGKNGAIDKVEAGPHKFERGKDGVKGITMKDGVISVKKQDNSVHTFKPNGAAEIKVPERGGQPSRTIEMKLDHKARPTEIGDGSTAHGGKGTKYGITYDTNGKITNVTENGKPLVLPGTAKDFQYKDGRILATTKDGGKVEVDLKLARKTTETSGKRTIETPRGKVEYKMEGGKPTSADIYPPGGSKPSFKATLDSDGRSVRKLTDGNGKPIGESGPGEAISLDDSGLIRVKRTDQSGKPISEITHFPSKSKQVTKAGETERYTPDGNLAWSLRDGKFTSFRYNRDAKGAVEKVPAGRSPDGKAAAVPARVKFNDGYTLDRIDSDDVRRQKPGETKFVLKKPNGFPYTDPKTGKPAEFKEACVDSSGKVHVKGDKGGWKELTPDYWKIKTEGGKGVRPGDSRPGGGRVAADGLRPGDRSPDGGTRSSYPALPWTPRDVVGTRQVPGHPHLLTKYDATTRVRTTLDTERGIKTETKREDGIGKIHTVSRIDPKTGDVSKETWTRVPPGTVLASGAKAGANTWQSDKPITYTMPDGSTRSVPKYASLRADLIGRHKSRFA